MLSRARINQNNVRIGLLAERDFPKLTGAAGKLATSLLYVEDSAALSMKELRKRVRAMWKQNQIKLLIIDSFQSLNFERESISEDRKHEIIGVSAEIKFLAEELGIPIIVVSTLKLDKHNEQQVPRLSDLVEYGPSEKYADSIILLHKDYAGNESELAQEFDDVPYWLNLAKQRNGATGGFGILYLKDCLRFENMPGPDDYEPIVTELKGFEKNNMVKQYDVAAFLIELRKGAPERWLSKSDERYANLLSLKEELLALDQDLVDLCKLRPANEKQYRMQHQQAEARLHKKAKAIFPELH